MTCSKIFSADEMSQLFQALIKINLEHTWKFDCANMVFHHVSNRTLVTLMSQLITMNFIGPTIQKINMRLKIEKKKKKLAEPMLGHK